MSPGVNKMFIFYKVHTSQLSFLLENMETLHQQAPGWITSSITPRGNSTTHLASVMFLFQKWRLLPID